MFKVSRKDKDSLLMILNILGMLGVFLALTNLIGQLNGTSMFVVILLSP